MPSFISEGSYQNHKTRLFIGNCCHEADFPEDSSPQIEYLWNITDILQKKNEIPIIVLGISLHKKLLFRGWLQRFTVFVISLLQKNNNINGISDM